jgi:hypothetical protein
LTSRLLTCCDGEYCVSIALSLNCAYVLMCFPLQRKAEEESAAGASGDDGNDGEVAAGSSKGSSGGGEGRKIAGRKAKMANMLATVHGTEEGEDDSSGAAAASTRGRKRQKGGDAL